MQLFIREEFSEESAAPLLAAMQRHDVERLGAQLTRTKGRVPSLRTLPPGILPVRSKLLRSPW